jgi:hypothetical protein
MEARIAHLESDVAHLRTDVADIEIVYVALAAGVFSTMARGFGWI